MVVKNRGKEKDFVPALIIVLSLFFLFEALRLGVSSVLINEGSERSIRLGFSLNPFDAEAYLRFARTRYLFMMGSEEEIERLFVKSLRLDPLLSYSWLGLSEVFSDKGEREKAIFSLRRAVELAPLYIANRWESALIALKVGDRQTAIESLRVVAKSDPQRRPRVFDLSWQVFGDPELILNRIVSDEALPSYLGYLIQKDRLKESLSAWERIERSGVEVSYSLSLVYIDFLIRKDRASYAYSIWRERFGEEESGSLIWNGGFEREPLGRGFDWRIGRVDGVRVDFDWAKRVEGRRSLRLRFDGKHNIDFYHIYQIVHVEPGAEYEFSSALSSEGITTGNGLSWELICYPRGGSLGVTEPLVGTTPWHRVWLSFKTPPECSSIMVRLRRKKSFKLDRFISGTLWVDDVKLKQVGYDNHKL
jgi:hypothetical protein